MSSDGPSLLCLGNDPDLINSFKIVTGLRRDKNNKSLDHHRNILTNALRRALSEAQREGESAECPALADSATVPHS